MSHPLIDRYHNDLAKALQFGKSTNEQSVRGYFWILLNEYARKQNFEVVLEKRILGTHGVQVQPDGALQNSWGLTLGIWESKDTKDDLEEEVDKKQKKGYPLTNALFEDTQHAVLFQYGEEVMRVDMKDSAKLHKLLLQWLSFKNATVVEFEKALDNFKADIPQLLEHLQRELIAAGSKNKDFILARDAFLELCRHEINPEVTVEDVREMLIQHLLTAELFQKIFDEPDFHRQNNIARELEKLLGTVFDYERRKNLLASIEHYYEAINATAAGITDHHEKQKFLKVLYENFYKAYNPKAADRLGVVYTPNEIVRFMVRSTDQLLHQHFGKSLSDEHVEILDPATGTGTFICDIIDHIRPDKLTHKYLEEIHANEVAILPYSVANLNIEFTFKQKMGHYKQFPNLCFVDTLDNTAGLGAGVQHDIFGISSENATRIRRQNERRISVDEVWACPSQKPRVALSARTPRSFVAAGYPLQSLTRIPF
ncbi:MAG: N-6 DNA methylase [Flavobacteriales bacterium]|nr:N-6 DNA methylase [Flavobacteriales bacterium]